MRFKDRFKMYLRAMPRSFYDPLQYRAAISQWTGIGALYLLILSAIISVFAVGMVGYGAYLFRHNELPAIVKQIPTIIVENGQVSVDAKQPVIIHDKDDKFKIVIDTNATSEELQKQDVMLGVGKDFVVYKSRDVYDTKGLQEFKDKMVIDQNSVKSTFTNLTRAIPVVLYPLSVLSQFVNYMFQALLIALCSYALTSIIREEFTLETRMRLAALALTPAVFITTASLIIFQHQMAMWFNLLLALLFMYAMILLMRRVPTAIDA